MEVVIPKIPDVRTNVEMPIGFCSILKRTKRLVLMTCLAFFTPSHPPHPTCFHRRTIFPAMAWPVLNRCSARSKLHEGDVHQLPNSREKQGQNGQGPKDHGSNLGSADLINCAHWFMDATSKTSPSPLFKRRLGNKIGVWADS